MPDPTGLSTGLLPWFVGRGLDVLLNNLYAELEHIRNFEKEFTAIKKQLDSFKLLYEEIDATAPRPLKSDFLQAWLDDVQKCLQELSKLVTSLQSAKKLNCANFMSIRKLRKDMNAKAYELEKLVKDGVVKRFLVQVVADNDEMRKLLLDLTQTTQNYLSSKGEKRAIVNNLTSIQSFSRNNQMNFLPHPPSPPQEHEYEHEHEHEPIFGREETIGELEKLLIDPRGPKIIALHGSGGAGKTHCVHELLSRLTGPHFKIYFTTVGGDSEMSSLLKRVEDYISRVNQDNVLIVLDDIWKREEIEFVQRKSSQYSGFRFLITTRQLKMIEACYDIHRVPIQVLSKIKSWELFRYHAFPSCLEKNIPVALKGVAELVAEECKGLPLALKVIGRAMSSKTMDVEWIVALDKLRNQVIIHNDQDDYLIRILRISYDVLETLEMYMGKIRECFLYFGSFVEDAEISVASLMNCWIGEGLLKDGENPMHQTYLALGVLIGSSLIEKVPGQEDACKIHDVLRDLTFHISRKDRPHQDLFQPGSTRQMRQDQVEYDKIIRISWSYTLFSPVQFKAPNLKVLLLDRSKVSESFLHSCFLSLCSLQVLSLAGTEIKYLPKSVGELKCLIVLCLARSSIKQLPYSLGKLTKLRILDITGCLMLTTLPKGALLDLKNLQVLRLAEPERRIDMLQSGIRSVRQFRDLTELTWFTFASFRKLPKNIEKMTELTILHMKCPIKDLEPLRRLHKLEDLEVVGSQLTRLPDWICEFSLLSRLVVQTENKIADYLPGLDTLCRLRILEIDGWDKLVSFPKTDGCANMFPCLELLKSVTAAL